MLVGANFGVEKNKSKRGNLSSLTSGGGDDDEGLTMEKLERSNRELARLFVEMFQPLGGDHITCVFNNENLADVARKLWANDLSAECSIAAIDRKRRKGGGIGGKKGKKKKAKGFAAVMADAIEDDGSSGPFKLRDGTEVGTRVFNHISCPFCIMADILP